MLTLKYIPVAVPGKALKRKVSADKDTDSSDSRSASKKKYEDKRERKFVSKWRDGRDWLVFDGSVMTCSLCINHSTLTHNHCLKGQNTFITGCKNLKISAINDHEKSAGHKKSLEISNANSRTKVDILNKSDAGRAIRQLSETERERLSILFRNAHAVTKNNRPLQDFTWLCELNKACKLDIGDTYINGKAALKFVNTIATMEKQKTINMIKESNFFAFMMDGSTDIAGDEQEALYIRLSLQGEVKERFLSIGTPKSTCSRDLKDFVCDSMANFDIDTGKLVAMGSDGASNMVGVKSGLSTLLRQEVNSEMVNVHCFAHRLELAFRDVFKKNKLYDKLMTLLIGLFYFYIKSYKNKKGLMESIKALEINGVLPQKVTGTRWLPHLSRGIRGLFRTFPAYEAHLSTISHDNAKAGGLAKLMLDKNVVCFAMFIQDLLDPLMRLSLKLQRPESTVSESIIWVDSTIDLLLDCKTRIPPELSDLLQSGTFKGVSLKGSTPVMVYKNTIIDNLVEALEARFQLNRDNDSPAAAVLNTTRILHFNNWPKSDSPDLREFGESEISLVGEHFRETLIKANLNFTKDEALQEWKKLKRMIYRRHGSDLSVLSWRDAFDKDFPLMMAIIDLLNCIPPTSVKCETTFSQMKLIKTSRRTGMKASTLNTLLTVKLLSPSIQDFDPKSSVDRWQADSIQGRRPGYHRRSKSELAAAATEASKETPIETNDNPVTDRHSAGDTERTEGSDIEDSSLSEDEEELEAEMAFEAGAGKDLDQDSFFEDFISEEATWDNLFSFARE